MWVCRCNVYVGTDQTHVRHWKSLYVLVSTVYTWLRGWKKKRQNSKLFLYACIWMERWLLHFRIFFFLLFFIVCRLSWDELVCINYRMGEKEGKEIVREMKIYRIESRWNFRCIMMRKKSEFIGWETTFYVWNTLYTRVAVLISFTFHIYYNDFEYIKI